MFVFFRKTEREREREEERERESNGGAGGERVWRRVEGERDEVKVHK